MSINIYVVGFSLHHNPHGSVDRTAVEGYDILRVRERVILNQIAIEEDG